MKPQERRRPSIVSVLPTGFVMAPLARALDARAARAAWPAASVLMLGALALPPPAHAIDIPFASPVDVTTTAAAVQEVQAADVDGDGDVDLLSASISDSKVAWYENDGSGAFALHSIATDVGATSVSPADVDGDGDLDVLATAAFSSAIIWFDNDGSQGFTRRTVDAAIPFPFGVDAADLDGDGDTDVTAASFTTSTVVWYENDGTVPPAFTKRAVPSAGGGEGLVRSADLDGDGDIDILSGLRNVAGAFWHENDGATPPAFTLRTISATPDRVYGIATADLDGDGDLDVLTSSRNDDLVAWHENDGVSPPGFTLHTVSFVADGALGVDVADLDADGDLDILSASRYDDMIAWYENDGSLAFTVRTISLLADGARSVLAVDIDGDHDLDVVSGSTESNTIAWFQGGACLAGVVGFRSPRMATVESDGRRAVQVTRRNGACGAVTVDYTDAGGTAGADADYRDNVAGTLSFPDGDVSRHFNVRVLDDAINEPNETVVLQLSNLTGGAASGAAQAVLSIRDDGDLPPQVSISGPASVTEGNDLVFTLTLDAPSGYDVEVNLGLVGTAQRAIDFAFRQARVIIPAGTTTLTRDLRAGATDIYSDGIADDGETIVLSIAGATNATIDGAQDTLAVTINDP